MNSTIVLLSEIYISYACVLTEPTCDLEEIPESLQEQESAEGEQENPVGEEFSLAFV